MRQNTIKKFHVLSPSQSQVIAGGKKHDLAGE